MIEVFKTVDCVLTRCDAFEDGIWVNLVNPTEEEISIVGSALNIEDDFLHAALDEEERPRIETDNGHTLVIVDIPIIEKEDNHSIYTTIPLAIILMKSAIVTVCLKRDTVLNDFIANRVKSFFTQYKTRFLLQILYRNALRYLLYLRLIDKTSSRIEADLHKSMKNKELIQLLKIGKSLVYFSTSLKANEVVLEKLMKNDSIKNYPEDADLLDDVIIENKQAIEMAHIYSSILSGTMDAFASVISNNLNIVMKFLTSVTIVMAIPNMISGFFGMNVGLPLTGSYAFWTIFLITLGVCGVTAYILNRKKLL